MIGLFDSGYGGLSVFRVLKETLPDTPLIYYADHEHCPYGQKSKEYLINRAEKITEVLIEQGAEIIVVACNTATAAAIDHLRNSYDIPFVGMEPAIKPAALSSITKAVGVLATEGTFSGKLFNETKEKYAKDIKVVIQPGTGLVELVEAHKMHTYKSWQVLYPLLKKMKEENVDQIVLGCTHYPFLFEDIQKLAGEHVTLIDPAPAVAKQVVRIKETILDFPKKGKAQFYQFITSHADVKNFRASVLKLVDVNGDNTLFAYDWS
ncbi:glutamate racemase [Flammeovirga sp. SubArs3]|uniref:glutamate racemase n=1 Tax=Flammeovirga sp. SubArs3 TaxID=2995316 RepID=UPI00248B135E|nr:glutamate racemase [Flammeovirga sp. SubArs3]